MGQDEQADVVEEPAVAASLAVVERIVSCGERARGGIRATIWPGVGGALGLGEQGGGGSRAAVRPGSGGALGLAERGGGGRRAVVRAGSCGGRRRGSGRRSEMTEEGRSCGCAGGEEEVGVVRR